MQILIIEIWKKIIPLNVNIIMNISFVIYFHSKRINNLNQTLRFLHERENLTKSEIILICQDYTTEKIMGIKPINLQLNSYHKTRMCNLGVRLAKNEVVALLDSDRILPTGYFGKIYSKIKFGDFFSTWKMYKLKKDYADEEIKLGKLEKEEDFKSRINTACKKNLFAGSTVFCKQNYLESGGMDESYKGYGFADTDMTRNIMARKYNIIWQEDEELHLYHPKETSFEGDFFEFFPEISTALNGLKYYKKWNLPKEKELLELIDWIYNNKDKIPEKIKKNNFKKLFIKI